MGSLLLPTIKRHNALDDAEAPGRLLYAMVQDANLDTPTELMQQFGLVPGIVFYQPETEILPDVLVPLQGAFKGFVFQLKLSAASLQTTRFQARFTLSKLSATDSSAVWPGKGCNSKTRVPRFALER